MKQHTNHTIGIILVIPLLIFFFYKSITGSNPFDDISALTGEIESLQVKLHRDILRYRSNQIRQYDTLNGTAGQISSLSEALFTHANTGEHGQLGEMLTTLKHSIDDQNVLIEDFKTSNSVLQNSLHYFSHLHTEILSDSSPNRNNATAALLGKLSSLLLDYTRKPEHETALKIYPLLDKLKANPGFGGNTLMNHSLIIIERLPVIDEIIEAFNSLDIERQIDDLQQLISRHQADADQHSVIYNSMLFFSSLYLLAYLGYMLLILRQNKNTLVMSNQKLNKEVEERTKTEKTLYRLVKETSSISDKDFSRNILYALYKTLGYRYAYISLISANSKSEASILGLVDNGKYQSNIDYIITDTPCEEILNHGRLVHNRDFQNYFPNWKNPHISHAESFIGITIKDDNNKVIGLLAVADDKAVSNTNLAENILSLAACRISTELLRHAAIADRERYHKGLESIDNWLLELISCAGNTQLFYDKVCQAAAETANASMAMIPLLDEAGENYIYTAASGQMSDKLIGTSRTLDDGGLSAWAILNRKAVSVNDVYSDIRTRREHIYRYRVKTAYVTPIYLNDVVFGALSVFRDATPFDNIDKQLINQFAQRVQLAIANMHLVKHIATEKERAELTLHSIGDAVITTGANGNIEYMNHIAERLTGCNLHSVHEQPVQTVFRILEQDTREPMHNVIEACLNEGTSISKSMTILVNHNGGERSIESSVSPIINRTGSVEGAVIVFHDETERRRMESIIHHQATHDALTGLINRDQFNIELKQHIHHAMTHDTRHVLCYLDLDGFKPVNDTCGHAAGDELLKQTASSLHNVIRTGDVLARLGGDEFGLILQNCPVNIACEIADKLIRSVSSEDFIWEGQQFSTGVSIGIIPITSQTDNISELLKHADAARCAAKSHGGNRTHVYDQQQGERLQRNEEFYWASRIADALQQDRFRIHAQAIYPLDPASNNATQVEILVRLEDENGHLEPPASFIPAVERYKLMGAVDQHIIRETFKFIAQGSIEGICFCINLSANSLNDDNLSSFIRQCADEFEIQADTICFDIPESVAMTSLVKTKILVEELQAEGFMFALDDFGSRMSSFGYLKDLPVNFLKIDGNFVRGMAHSRTDHALVAAINQFGHTMGISTIAEFVENDRILDKLRAMGVDFAQGYSLSGPVPLSEASLKDMLRSVSFKNGLASAS